MKHPFNQLLELTDQELESVNGAYRFLTLPSDYLLDKQDPGLRRRPDFATTMAIGEEGGNFPGVDYF